MEDGVDKDWTFVDDKWTYPDDENDGVVHTAACFKEWCKYPEGRGPWNGTPKMTIGDGYCEHNAWYRPVYVLEVVNEDGQCEND